MTLWPRLEPLLAKVQKPARYIGCEDGAIVPVHGPGKVAWLLVYPDTYEIGLPNQGLQILYEILNERDDAVAERAYAPWTDLDAELRRHGLPLFSVDTHRAAASSTSSPSTCRPSSSTPTSSNCVDLAGVPVRNEDRRDEHPLIARRRPRHLQPRAAGRLRRPLRHRRGRGGGVRDHRGGPGVEGLRAARGQPPPGAAPAGRASRACTSRRCTTSPTTDPRLRGRHPALPGRPRADRQAHRGRSGRLALPEAASSCPLTEVVHDRLSVEVFRGCTQGMPVLPGGDDHPARSGSARPSRCGPWCGTGSCAPATTR